jgi:hypothetical protein
MADLRISLLIYSSEKGKMCEQSSFCPGAFFPGEAAGQRP